MELGKHPRIDEPHSVESQKLPIAEQKARLLAWSVPGVGAKTFAAILSAFGSMQQALDITESVWLRQGLSRKLFSAWCQAKQIEAKADAMISWSQQENQHLIFLTDPDYPEALKEAMAFPPPLLFAKGQLQTLAEPQLAMVGARTPTAEGSGVAFQMAKYLAERGVCVVSGLAKGIDTAAHQGALKSGGPTVAVVAHGLDQIYPKANVNLAKQIQDAGLILSEFPLGVGPRPQQFPRRNALISGLSLGVCVVQAALKSGSLITARWALEQNREVFAVPGSIHCPLSKGTHHLIRQGAKLVESAADMLEELGSALSSHLAQLPETVPIVSVGQAQVSVPSSKSLTHQDHPLLRLLAEKPMQLDELMMRSGMAADQLSAQLLELELKLQLSLTTSGYELR